MNSSTECEPRFGRALLLGWFENTVVLKLQMSAKSSSVSLLLECFSPTVVYPVNWEEGTVPWETAALAAKEKCSIYHAGEEKGRARVACKAGPRRAAVFTDFSSSVHMRLSVHSSMPVTRVEVSEVATPNPAEIKSSGV